MKINDLSSNHKRVLQEGFKFLAMGSMEHIRNRFSHGDEPEISPHEAFDLLRFLNYLIHNVEISQF